MAFEIENTVTLSDGRQFAVGRFICTQPHYRLGTAELVRNISGQWLGTGGFGTPLPNSVRSKDDLLAFLREAGIAE